MKRSPKRTAGGPEGGDLAQRGFYTAAVQRVVRKWKGQIPSWLIEEYFRQVSNGVVLHMEDCQFQVGVPRHWKFVFEVGSALQSVLENKKKPDAWLLKMPIDLWTNGKLPTWKEVSQSIEQTGGAYFTPECLKNRYKGLKLTTPAHISPFE